MFDIKEWVMNLLSRTVSNTKLTAKFQLVVSDEKSSLRVEAKGDNIAAVKAEGRGLRHSNFQPTGRYAKRGTLLDIIVSPSISGLEVVIGQWGNYEHLNDGSSKTPEIISLNPGVNRVVAPIDGMVYIQSWRAEADAFVDVYGGQAVPTYIKGVTERAEFDLQLSKWASAPFIELIGESVLANFQYAMAVRNLEATPTDLDRRIAMMDEVVAHTNAFCGLSRQATDFSHKASHFIYIANPDTGAGYASAEPHRITFPVSTGAGSHLLVGPEDDQWGLYHEVGHTYQLNEITWAGLGEISVNIYGLAVQEAMGYPNYLDVPSTHEAVQAFRETPIAERNFAGIKNDRLKVLMFDQLRRGFGANFYAQLF